MQQPLIIKTSIFQLQLEGGYDLLIYRLQPEGSFNSLVFRLQSEGGYDLLSLPRPTACHLDKNIDTKLLNHNCIDPADLLINTCTTLHNLYHTAQPLPLLTIAHHLITTHQLTTVHCTTTIPHCLSTCTINRFNQAIPINLFLTLTN